MSFDALNEWDPMMEAYKNRNFNSYVSGPLQMGSRGVRKPSLYVKYVPAELSEEAITHIFSKFGNVTKSVLKYSQEEDYTFGYINFATIEEAEAAFRRIDRRDLFGMHIELSRSMRDANQSMYQGNPGFDLDPAMSHRADNDFVDEGFKEDNPETESHTPNMKITRFGDGQRAVGLLPTPPHLLNLPEGVQVASNPVMPYDYAESEGSFYPEEEEYYYDEVEEDLYPPVYDNYPPHYYKHPRPYSNAYDRRYPASNHYQYGPYEDPCYGPGCAPRPWHNRHNNAHCCSRPYGNAPHYPPEVMHPPYHARQRSGPRRMEHVPELKPNVTLCSFCGNISSFACSFCDEPYCSRKCIVAAWPTHESECLAKRRGSSQIDDEGENIVKDTEAIPVERCPPSRIRSSNSNSRTEALCNGNVPEARPNVKTKVNTRNDISQMECLSGPGNDPRRSTSSDANNLNKKFNNIRNESNEKQIEDHSFRGRGNFTTGPNKQNEHSSNRSSSSQVTPRSKYPLDRPQKCYEDNVGESAGNYSFSKPPNPDIRKKKLDLDGKIFAKGNISSNNVEPTAEAKWDDSSVGIQSRISAPPIKSVSPAQTAKSSPAAASPDILVPKTMASADLKETTLNSSEKVTGCFTHSPAKFWIQRLADSRVLAEIASDLEELSKRKTPLSKPSVGDFCGSLFGDGNLYRSKVLKVCPGGTCEVYYVDFGNTEQVKMSDMCYLSSKLATYPSLAICCSLADIKPSNGASAWKSEDIEFLKHFIEGQELKAHVIKAVGSTYTIDLVTNEGLSVSSILVSEKYADWISPQNNASINEVPEEKDVDSTENSLVETIPNAISSFKIGSEVTIAPVEVGGDFLWGMVNNPKVTEPFLAMEEELKDIKTKDVTLSVEVGDIAVARSIEYGIWYRSFIKERKKDRVLVRYIDYGNEEEVKELREPPPEHMKVCSPLLHMKLPADLPQEVRQSFFINAFQTTVKSLQKDSAKLSIQYKEQHFWLQGSPWSYGLNILSETTPYASSDENMQKKDMELKKNEPVKSPLKQDKASEKDAFRKAILLERPLLSGRTPITVVWIKSAKEVYCQRACDAAEIAHLTEEMNLHCNSQKCENYVPERTEIICAKYTSDGGWYRSFVRQILPDSKYHVVFVDFGNEDIVSSQDIRELNEKFTCPRFSIRVNLHGIKPDIPASDIYQKVADKIVEMEVVNTQEKTKSVILYEGGKQLFPLATEGNIQVTKNAEAAKGSPMQVVLKKNSLPTSTIEFKNSDIRIVHVDELKNFHVRLLSHEDEFRAFQKNLFTFCSSGQPATHYVPNVDDLVCVLSNEEWHRGCVTEVIEQSCLIKFIDSGSTQKVSFANIKPLPPKFLQHAFSIAVTLDQVPKMSLTDEVCENMTKNFYKLELVDATHEPAKAKLLFQNTCVNDFLNEALDNERGSISPIDGRKPKNALLSSLRKQSLPCNEPINVVFWFNQDDKYFLQRVCDLELIDQMTATLQTYCESAAPLTSSFSVGELFCVKSVADGIWYRACVEEVLSADNCKVQYIDYGNSESANKSNMRILPEQLASFPIFCICVTISDEERKLQPVELEKVTIIEVIGAADNYRAKIVTEDNTCAAELALPAKEVSPPEASVSIDKPDSVQTPAAKNAELFLIHDCRYIDFPLGEKIVIVYSVTSYDFLFCAPFVEENILANNELVEELTAYCGQLEATGYQPAEVGEIVIAKFPDDGRWYRATVADLAAPNYDVWFIDYGGIACLKEDGLRKMDKRFMQLPVQATLAKLGGFIVSKENIEEVNKEVLQVLTVFTPLVATVSRDEQAHILNIPEINQHLAQKNLVTLE